MAYISFNCFEIELDRESAESMSHSGQCDDDVREYLRHHNPLAGIDPDLIRDELRGHGAWSEEELADDADNAMRIIWIAANDYIDELEQGR